MHKSVKEKFVIRDGSYNRNDLHMTVERYVSDESVDGAGDDKFIR